MRLSKARKEIILQHLEKRYSKEEITALKKERKARRRIEYRLVVDHSPKPNRKKNKSLRRSRNPLPYKYGRFKWSLLWGIRVIKPWSQSKY
jgi:hypothetical protein